MAFNLPILFNLLKKYASFVLIVKMIFNIWVNFLMINVMFNLKFVIDIKMIIREVVISNNCIFLHLMNYPQIEKFIKLIFFIQQES